MLLGCIGDDFTGSSDLANTLTKAGMRVTQYTGVPSEPAAAHVEAGVVALKTRSIAAPDAVRQSLDALEWLQAQGCTQFFFKYCSTFDSTPEGNIGPVAQALAAALDATRVVVCPAFPGAGRSVYQGHLFVNDQLLSESGMATHPLTPMTDSDLRRWLALQTSLSVGHVAASAVSAGAEAIANALDREHQAGNTLVVVDALTDEHLRSIGRAAAGLPLVTGGSGVALGLPANFADRIDTTKTPAWNAQPGQCAILAGSCSAATRAQVAAHREKHLVIELTAEDVIEQRVTAAAVATQMLAAKGIPLATSSASPEIVAKAQQRFGQARSAEAIESFFAEVAHLLVDGGVTALVTAGGETSGAVVDALGITAMEIGLEIAPGVPALRAGPDLVLALKSGNFGDTNFFATAASVLTED